MMASLTREDKDALNQCAWNAGKRSLLGVVATFSAMIGFARWKKIRYTQIPFRYRVLVGGLGMSVLTMSLSFSTYGDCLNSLSKLETKLGEEARSEIRKANTTVKTDASTISKPEYQPEEKIPVTKETVTEYDWEHENRKKLESKQTKSK